MNARVIRSVLKIRNFKLVKICFKFTSVANITGDVSISRNFSAKGRQNIDLKCKLENYDGTQLPLESELSYASKLR